MISSRRFREKMSASDRHDGRSSGRRAIVQQPDAATLPTLVGKHSIRFQQVHADEATSRSRHLPHPRRRRHGVAGAPHRSASTAQIRDAQPGSVGFAAEEDMGRATPEAWSARLQRAWGRATSGTAARPWGMVAYRARDTSARRAPAFSLKQVVAPDLMGIPLRLPR